MNSASITRLVRVAFGVLALFCVLADLAHAGTATSISGLYTTGIDGSDSGTRDDHWKLSNGNGAYVVSSSISGWMANTPSAKWISYDNDGVPGSNGSTGTYTYTLTFNITGAAGTTTGESVTGVKVYMTLAVDDSTVITLNGGNAVSTTGTGQWARTQNVTLSDGFKVGQNTITVTVSNSGGGASGLLVTSISGVVPEVGTWVPLVVAFGLVAWARFRPRKRSLPAAV